jgi:hypothetical protein
MDDARRYISDVPVTPAVSGKHILLERSQGMYDNVLIANSSCFPRDVLTWRNAARAMPCQLLGTRHGERRERFVNSPGVINESSRKSRGRKSFDEPTRRARKQRKGSQNYAAPRRELARTFYRSDRGRRSHGGEAMSRLARCVLSVF